MFGTRVPPTFAIEGKAAVQGNIKPSTRGAVSIRRGGGAFEFTIAPDYNPNLDSSNENLVCIGRVVEGPSGKGLLEYINTIPTRKDIVSLTLGTDVPPLGSSFARVCDFTNPDPTCAQYKPLKIIKVTGSNVVSKRVPIVVNVEEFAPVTNESPVVSQQEVPVDVKDEVVNVSNDAMGI